MQNFHPYVVHFPVALIILAFCFDLLARIRREGPWEVLGRYTLVIGTLSAVAGVASGLWAEETVAHGAAVHDLMEAHEAAAFWVLGLSIVASVLRVFTYVQSGKVPTWYLVFGLMAAVAVGRTGHLGGKMVYEHGTGTALTASTGAPAAAAQGGDKAHDHDSHDHDH